MNLSIKQNGFGWFPRFVVLGLLTAFSPATPQQEVFPSVKTIEISPALAEKGDSVRIDFLRKKGAKISTNEDRIYIVKICFNCPLPADNDGFRILVDEKPVEEFGSFKNGIFLKVYDADVIRKLKHKEIVIVRRGRQSKSGFFIPDIDSISAVFSMQPNGKRVVPSITEVLSK